VVRTHEIGEIDGAYYLTMELVRGVIHRDIKSQNLLLDDTGVLKVMDFGIARLAEGSSGLTEAGMMIGTPAYMAPEQVMGEAIDARSDLYSVGVVLYECLTGRVPFSASTIVSLVARLLSDQPPPIEDADPALAALVMRLLAKKPEERIGSAGELGREIARLG